MRRWLRRLLFLVTPAFIVALPPVHWRLIGWWRVEPFLNGRPASFHRPLCHINKLPTDCCVPAAPNEWPGIRRLFGNRVADWLTDSRSHPFDRNPEAVPVLMALLRDPDWDVRVAAVFWLGLIGTAAKDALPTLRQMQREWDDSRYNRCMILG